MNTTSGSARAWRATLAVVLVLATYWLVSWSRVSVWLERDAERAEYALRPTSPSPWRWWLSNDSSVVWPGSRGFERDGLRNGLLLGTLTDGLADLSLDLRGAYIDRALYSGAGLFLEATVPVRVSVIGDSSAGSVTLGTTTTRPRQDLFHIRFTAGDGVLQSLRLRLEAPAGTQIGIDNFSLQQRDDLSPQACASAVDVDVMFAKCTTRVPRLTAPPFALPEQLLHWRDRIVAERPGAVLRSAVDTPLGTSLAEAVRAAPQAWAYWLLSMLPLIAAAMSRTTRTSDSRRPGLELALIFLPWLLVLWWDLPGDPHPEAVTVFVACLAGAMMVRDPAPDWHLQGPIAAWKAVAKFVVLLAPILLLAGVANALDDDGFRMRRIDPHDSWRYPLWALVQQLILMRCIAPRAHLIMGSHSGAALATGALFGLLHLPNFGLMVTTFVAGSGWAWLAFRHRALLPLAASHAVLGLTLLLLAPSWLLRSAEIGARYLMTP